MTIQIDVNRVVKLFSESAPDAEGWVTTSLILSKLASEHTCKPLTARNFLIRNTQYFEFQHGRVRLRKENVATVAEQSNIQEEFTKWLKEREALLDECVAYLSSQDTSPYLENFFVQIASLREELRSYNDSRLLGVLADLKRDYDFEPKTELKESI